MATTQGVAHGCATSDLRCLAAIGILSQSRLSTLFLLPPMPRSLPLSRPLFAGFAIAITARAANAQANHPRPFTIDDALAVRSARIDDVSKDGRWIALGVRVRRDGLGEFELIDAATGRARAILPGKVDVRGAAFSRDGAKLAFLLRKGDDYVLDIDDVASNRVRTVAVKTRKPIASNSPLVWAPDGNSVLVALRPDGWASGARAAFLQLTEGEIVVQDARQPFLAWDSVRNVGNRQIPAVVNLADGSVREVVGETDMRAPQFTADASHIVYSTAVPKKTSYDNRSGTEYGAFRVAVTGGKIDTLLKPADRRVSPKWNDEGSAFAYEDRGNVFVRFVDGDSARNLTARYRKPVATTDSAKTDSAKTDTTRTSYAVVAWRPDGGALLVSSRDGWHLLDPRTGAMSPAYAFESDTATRPTRTFESWSHDGRYLFVTTSAKDHWARGIERYDLDTKQATALVSDANAYASWHVSDDGTRFVFERSDGDRPNEVYAAGRDFTDAHALTDLNPQLAGVALTHSELVSYLDVDGKTLHGVLYYPYGYQPGKKYPLVAEIYETFFDNGYNENMNLLAAQSWFVFHPSVDLQIGYPGEAWVKGVTDGINSLEQKGLVDGTKLGVEGQSYGGYATNLLITQTNRFKAAVNISGKVDIISFLGDSPRIGTRNYSAAENGQDRIGQTLWQAPMKYIQHSAIFYADRITTPLLMLTGKDDWNVPDTNEREMYYALRRLGKEAVWVQYAHAGHGAGRAGTPDEFQDHWTRMFDWFRTHFDKTATVSAQAMR
jgi:dipeptidyl aminopeptidase/acylaminoacyl peptidase